MDNQQLNSRRRGDNGYKERDSMLPLRNWLNIIFMLGAVVGVGIYLYGEQTTGTIIVLVAMIFKMAESALRFFR